MNIKGILAAALSTLALVSCVKNEFVPSAANPSAAFAKKNITIASKGETVQVGIKATCDWTATSGASWVKVSPEFGTCATKDITITVDTENTADESRETKVILANAANTADCDTLVIIQKPSGGTFDGHIRTAEHMLLFLEMAPAATDADFFTFENDINMEGATLIPAATFTGTLDGQGHKLYNFVIESDKNAAGIILNNTGLVKNLNVGTADGKTWDKVSTIKFKDGISGTAAGVIATNSGLVGGINNFATIEFNADSAADYADAAVGGIVGNIGTENAQIIDCNNYGTILYTGTQGARSSMGGILGFNGQAGPAVENCANYGAISKATANAKEFAMAGVVGRSNDAMIIKGCTNAAPVSYESTDKPGSYIHIAGVVGAAYKNCQILDCTNKGAISSVILQVNRIGGIAGTMNTGGLIRECRNDGQVTINQGANANWQAAAGICGFEEKATASLPLRIEKCTNNGEVSGVFENTNTHNNQVALAGIIGTTCSVVEYSGNVNNGKIVARNTGSANVYAGGIYGWYRAGSGFNSHDNINNGAVSVEAPSGAAGGIIGNLAVAASQMKNETNKGAVAFATASAVGSIAGLTAAPVNSCAVGGKVNDVEITQANFASYIVGSASTGAPVACYFEGGSGPVAYVAVAPAAITVPFGGANATVSVTSNTEWDYACAETWVEVSVPTGAGESKEVLLTIAPNSVKEQRVATVTFTSKTDAAAKATLTITQEPYTDGLPGNKIASAADWAKFVAIAADAASGEVFTLENDITLAGADFKSVPSFAGVFNGQNHTITLDAEVAGTHVALFEKATGIIKNIKTKGRLKNVYEGGDEYRVAAVVAVLTGGTVENCTNDAEIISDCQNVTANKYGYAAGVVGVFNGDAVAVRNCVNNGKITYNSASCVILGGVAAYSQTQAGNPSFIFEYCENNGDIVIDHAGGNWDYIGGVIGKIGASSNPFSAYSISHCSFTGTLTVKKAPKIRGGGVIGSAGVSNDYLVSNCTFSGTIDIQSTEAVDRLFAGVGAGFSEAAASGTVKDCVFDGTLKAVDGGNIYFGGIFGNNGAATIVLDGNKSTSKAVINGGTKAKSVGMIAGRPNKAGFTIKNNKVAGKITDGEGTEVTITAENLADWMIKGSGTTVEVVLENNTFNAE